MKSVVGISIFALGLFLGGIAVAADSVKARDTSCRVLQDRIAADGRITFKVFLGTLTVFDKVPSCDTSTHQVITPAWRTADDRACVVGSYCTILNHGHID